MGLKDCLRVVGAISPRVGAALKRVNDANKAQAKAAGTLAVGQDVAEIIYGLALRGSFGGKTVMMNAASGGVQVLKDQIDLAILYSMDRLPMGDKVFPPPTYALDVATDSTRVGWRVMVEQLSRALGREELRQTVSKGGTTGALDAAKLVAGDIVRPPSAAEFDDVGRKVAGEFFGDLYGAEYSKQAMANQTVSKGGMADTFWNQYTDSPDFSGGAIQTAGVIMANGLNIPLRYMGSTDAVVKTYRYISAEYMRHGQAVWDEVKDNPISRDEFRKRVQDRFMAQYASGIKSASSVFSADDAHASTWTQTLSTPVFKNLAKGFNFPGARLVNPVLPFMARVLESATYRALPVMVKDKNSSFYNPKLAEDLASPDPFIRKKAEHRIFLSWWPVAAIVTAVAGYGASEYGGSEGAKDAVMETIHPFSPKNKSLEALQDTTSVASGRRVTTGGTITLPGTSVTIPMDMLDPKTSFLLNGVISAANEVSLMRMKQTEEEEWDDYFMRVLGVVMSETGSAFVEGSGMQRYLDDVVLLHDSFDKGSTLSRALDLAGQKAASMMVPRMAQEAASLVTGDDRMYSPDGLVQRLEAVFGGDGVPLRRDWLFGSPIQRADRLQLMSDDLPVYVEAVTPGGKYQPLASFLHQVGFSRNFPVNRRYAITGEAGSSGVFLGLRPGADTVKMNKAQRDAYEYYSAVGPGKGTPPLVDTLQRIYDSWKESADQDVHMTVGEVNSFLRGAVSEHRELARDIIRFDPRHKLDNGKTIFDHQTSILVNYLRNEKRASEEEVNNFLNERNDMARSKRDSYAHLYSQGVPR